MKVLKFGGTSVGSAERIKHVANLVSPRGRNIIVLSAMAGTTNTLVEICDYLYKKNQAGALETVNALQAKYDTVLADLFGSDRSKGGTRGGAMVSAAAREAREQAAASVSRCLASIRSLMAVEFTETDEKEILAQGELMSTAIMLAYLRFMGVKAVMLPALKFMRTDENGEPDFKYTSVRLKRLIDMNPDADLYITQGYICRNEYGDVDNLQRGGSDYTASIIGAALDLEEIQIWTDIDGMHNNDPRYVQNTRPVSELHFEEAAELAYFGAKILHPACVLPARLHNIPIRLLNTMEPDKPGTLISSTLPSHTIKAVSAKDGITAIHIKSGRMFLAYSFLLKVFETFDRFKTPIDMVATSEVGVTVTVDNPARLDAIVDELKKFGTVQVDTDMVIICVVGDLEWHNRGFEAKAIEALGDIPLRMISYGGSNYNIAVVVRSQDKVEALNRLSAKLFS
ncbi:MAG: aspartate kinase [Muribaculaceae bacterium]|nr:aspartate kinase [Muribaculaceae bacterium]